MRQNAVRFHPAKNLGVPEVTNEARSGFRRPPPIFGDRSGVAPTIDYIEGQSPEVVEHWPVAHGSWPGAPQQGWFGRPHSQLPATQIPGPRTLSIVHIAPEGPHRPPEAE
jgi:hypothetical protein